MKNFDYQDIKQELQGNKGLIKEIRKRYIPSTIEMAIHAQNKFKIEKPDFSDFDHSLNRLLQIEYELYLDKQKQIIERFIEFADIETNAINYPVVREVINEYEYSVKDKNEPTKSLSGITKIVIALADSNRQSRVSRSGSSLMNHVSYLLDKNGFIENKDFRREYVLFKGCKLDFFFPNRKMYEMEPKNCCAVACQTTSNDRFRLTFAQLPSDTRNRACTAIGSKNFGSKLGPDSLTEEKLNEAKEKGVKFVILESGIDSRLDASQAVMSYKEWLDELKSLKAFW
ncbi:type II restriction endonuclease [Gracilimonas sp.]|uniref:type II restriction endonuclease n=1 Tax=Gracilimonas sp. TaxID=1974203 RepID=UPI003D097877